MEIHICRILVITDETANQTEAQRFKNSGPFAAILMEKPQELESFAVGAKLGKKYTKVPCGSEQIFWKNKENMTAMSRRKDPPLTRPSSIHLH